MWWAGLALRLWFAHRCSNQYEATLFAYCKYRKGRWDERETESSILQKIFKISDSFSGRD